MSTKIPLTYNIEYEVELAADSLNPARIQETSAEQSIFFCHCLFYLLREAAIGASRHPLFKPAMFLTALEAVSLIGEALCHPAHEHIEHLSNLAQAAARQTKK